MNVRYVFQLGLCDICDKPVWIWQQTIRDDVCHLVCSEPVPLPETPPIDLEEIIREEFDRFDDYYLKGEQNRLLRQRTGRLCESVIQVVLREIDIKSSRT